MTKSCVVLLLGFAVYFSCANGAETAPSAEKSEKMEKAEKIEKIEKTEDRSEERADRDEGSEADIASILASVGYPELQVVPRASERLRMEAREERSYWFLQHWPVQLSGLVTLYVGVSSSGNKRDNLSDKDRQNARSVSTLTSAVGAGWLVGGILLGAMKPYSSGVALISKSKGKDERSELFRERLAEEALERPAKIMRNLQWIAVASDALVNGLSMIYVTDQGKAIAGAGILMSFLPVLFEDHTIDVFNKHVEYKKKIYAPIKSASFSYDPQNRSLIPMTNLVWNF